MTPRPSSAKPKVAYAVLGIIISALIILIGWFVYLLANPTPSTNTATTSNKTPTNSVNKTAKNKNANTVRTNVTATTNTTNTNSAVNTTTTTNTNSNSANTNADGTKTITLYFPKAAGACGAVYAVSRSVTPADDFYGQVILEDLDGPSSTDTGYTTAIPADLRLREVRYTSAGPVITVNDAYDGLNDCDKSTVAAQLVKTANLMFDLPEDTAGEVVVGTVDDNADTNTNDNTNSNDNTNT